MLFAHEGCIFAARMLRSKPPKPAVRDAAMNTSFLSPDGSSYPPAGGQPRRGLSEVAEGGKRQAVTRSC